MANGRIDKFAWMLVGLLAGGGSVGLFYNVTLVDRMSQVEAAVSTLDFPFWSEEAILWRASMQAHQSNPEIHQSAIEKVALIREVINAVLDERERGQHGAPK